MGTNTYAPFIIGGRSRGAKVSRGSSYRRRSGTISRRYPPRVLPRTFKQPCSRLVAQASNYRVVFKGDYPEQMRRGIIVPKAGFYLVVFANSTGTYSRVFKSTSVTAMLNFIGTSDEYRVFDNKGLVQNHVIEIARAAANKTSVGMSVKMETI